AGRQFQAQGTPGVILNTSSVYAQMASEMTFTYNVSKAAVDMMTKCAALELAPLGIRVCAIAPGRVDTAMLRQYDEIGLWNHI
ncbi:SDR family oxidoreductase, partial [Escherichia coli]|nr:SDR family oxidoreductase [Escherichia coli]